MMTPLSSPSVGASGVDVVFFKQRKVRRENKADLDSLHDFGDGSRLGGIGQHHEPRRIGGESYGKIQLLKEPTRQRHVLRGDQLGAPSTIEHLKDQILATK